MTGRERALVLGGGGSAGNAWVIGVIAGLYDGGLDVTGADLVIGTSAGSTAAAQITSQVRPPELYAEILAAPPPPPGAGGVGPDRGGAPRPVTDHMERTQAIIAASRDVTDLRRRMGAAALELDAGSDGSAQARWRATVAARLPSRDWPERDVRMVVVDAHTGERLVLDRGSGVALADAVAASCANGFGVPPITLGETHYIDGGYPSAENADLAAGYERVLVLSPFGGRTRAPLEWGEHLAAHADRLRAGGAKVETIFPDDASREAFGANMMNPATRPPSARAGYAQGKALAQQLAGFWR
jgi:NTE family protein